MSGEQNGPKSVPPHRALTLLAAVGAIAIAAAVPLAVAMVGETGDEQPARVADRTGETMFSIHGVQELEGTNLVRMSITTSESRDDDPYGSYQPRADDIRNILLLDKATGAARKLLPDNMRRIANASFLSARGDLVSVASGGIQAIEGDMEPSWEPQEPAPAAYYVLTVDQVENDQLKDIFVGALESGSGAYAMRGIDGVDSMWTQSATRIGFLVRDKLRLYHRILDIPSMKMVESRRIEIDR